MADDPRDRAADLDAHVPPTDDAAPLPAEDSDPDSTASSNPGGRRATVVPTMVPLHRRTGARRTLRTLTVGPTTPTRPDAPGDDADPPDGVPPAEAVPDGEQPDGEQPDGAQPDHDRDAAAPPPGVPVAKTLATPGHRPPDPPQAVPRDDTARDTGEPDLAWAATSVLLAAVGARLHTWRVSWTWARMLRAATASAAVLVVMVLGLAWGATSWVEAAIRDIGALDPDSSSIQDAEAQQGDQNYLVVGSDTRVGATPDEAVGDDSGIPGARSDTVMVVHVPEDRSRVTVVSFPRDLEVDRPACERWDPRTGAYSGLVAPPQVQAKLNTAYQVGGPRCVTKVVQALSGLAVNHFLGVDFQGFKGMVDAVGGVAICVERPIRDTVLGDVVDRAGPTVLSGDQALDFVRARHVVGDPTSDYGRIQRQQRFLSALLRATLSTGTLFDLSKLRGLVEAVSRSTFGENVGADQLLSLGRSLGGIDTRTVTFTTVPTTGVANARGNEVLRAGEDRALFSAVIANQPLPGQAPAPGAPALPVPAEVPPEQVTVRLVDARAAATGVSTSASDDGGSDSGSGSGSGDSGSSDSSSGDSDDSGSGDDSGDRSEFRHGGTLGVRGARTAGRSTESLAESLRERGFTVVVGTRASTGNEPVGGTEAAGPTVIRFSPDQQDAADTLARAVPAARLVPTTGATLLDLVVGADFDGHVVDPTQVAVPVAPTITAADTACS